jgi:hypothetical protein
MRRQQASVVSERRKMRYEREKLDVRGGKVSQRKRQVQVVFGGERVNVSFRSAEVRSFRGAKWGYR